MVEIFYSISSLDPLKGDSMPTVLANLSNAFLIIVLLYIRKLYLFSKISRKILKERRLNMEGNMQFEPFAEGQQQYGGWHLSGCLNRT